MIKKIISGGQTGADQAALDTAIQWKIPHGGCIPKGRMTEAGRLPEKYKLTEMTAENCQKSTEKNVIDSDGTLVITHGHLTGDSLLTRLKAEEHNKAYLHINLDKTGVHQAAHIVNKWVDDENIETLNVAGSKLSKDKYIYTATRQILATVLRMEQLESGKTSSHAAPQTVEDVIEELIEELPLKEKTQTARMPEHDLSSLQSTLGMHIRNKYLCNGNEDLIIDCLHKSGSALMDEKSASYFIIHELWKQLKETHRLRIVKGNSS